MPLSKGMPHLVYEQDIETGEVPTRGSANETKSTFTGFQTVQYWVPFSVLFKWNLTVLQLYFRWMEHLERTETVYKEDRSLTRSEARPLHLLCLEPPRSFQQNLLVPFSISFRSYGPAFSASDPLLWALSIHFSRPS